MNSVLASKTEMSHKEYLANSESSMDFPMNQVYEAVHPLSINYWPDDFVPSNEHYNPLDLPFAIDSKSDSSVSTQSFDVQTPVTAREASPPECLPNIDHARYLSKAHHSSDMRTFKEKLSALAASSQAMKRNLKALQEIMDHTPENMYDIKRQMQELKKKEARSIYKLCATLLHGSKLENGGLTKRFGKHATDGHIRDLCSGNVEKLWTATASILRHKKRTAKKQPEDEFKNSFNVTHGEKSVEAQAPLESPYFDYDKKEFEGNYTARNVLDRIIKLHPQSLHAASWWTNRIMKHGTKEIFDKIFSDDREFQNVGLFMLSGKHRD